MMLAGAEHKEVNMCLFPVFCADFLLIDTWTPYFDGCEWSAFGGPKEQISHNL